MKSKYQQCVEEWEPSFRTQSSILRSGIDLRKCQDAFCIPVFLILVTSLICFCSYLINIGYELYKGTAFQINFLYNFPELTSQGSRVILSLWAIIAFNNLLLVGVIVLFGTYPQVMIHGLVVFSVLTLSGMSVYCFVTQEYALGAILMLLLVIYIMAMCCVFREYYKTGVVLAHIVGCFLSRKPSTLMIGVFINVGAFVCGGILLLSAAGLLQMIAFGTISNTKGEFYLLMQIVEYLFLLYLTYYSITFLISCSVSNWYSQNFSYRLGSGMGLMFFNHLGSLTFASLAITPIKIINTIADSAQKNTDNMCAQISICLLKPCLFLFEGLVKTLNRYSIMTIAFTGQGFVSGAKTAAVITSSNLRMCRIVEGIQNFFHMSLWLLGVIWSVGLGIIAAWTLNLKQGVIFTTAVLVMMSTITSLIWTSIFTETLQSTFFFFLMQQKVKTYKYRVFNIQNQVKDLFSDVFTENDDGTLQDSDDQVVVPRQSIQKQKLKTAYISEMHDMETQNNLNWHRQDT